MLAAKTGRGKDENEDKGEIGREGCRRKLTRDFWGCHILPRRQFQTATGIHVPCIAYSLPAMKPGPGLASRFPLSIAVALVFFCGLWLLDFPRPMVDDLFYTGAALNLAGGGDFSHSMLGRQEVPRQFFFFYSPRPSPVLAGL